RIAIPLSDIRKITVDTLGMTGVNRPLPPQGGGKGMVRGGLYPNPVHTSTTIDFDLLHSGDVNIQILTSNRQVVRSISAPRLEAGHNQIVWNGLDDSGAPVQSGTYLFEVRSKDFVQSRKAVV